MTRIFVFPGQGSQYKGMGKDLFAAFPDEVAEADRILGYPIRSLCLEDPESHLRNTAYTQPAMFCVNALAFLAKGVMPDAVAGHSLGEYDALFAAGVFDFATGLRLVKRRAELMSQARNGSMAAVMGIDAGKVRHVLTTEALTELDVANLNSPTQTVIAGPKPAIERAQSAFQKAGARYAILNVSAAFHSRYMSAAAEEFSAFLAQFQFGPARIPVMANVTGRPYARTPEAVREGLSQQISHPVQWLATVTHLLNYPEPSIEEIGPGNVLTRLIQEIRAAPRAPAAPPEPPVARPDPPQPEPLPVRPQPHALVFLYTGQGSQYFKMADAMYREEPVFRESMDRCARIAEPFIGAPLLDILFSPPDPFAPFDRLLYSNPALVAVGYSLTQVVAARGITPGSVIGYGVGEVAAAVVAGAMSLEDGLHLSIEHARAIEDHGSNGRMLAVFDSSEITSRYASLFEGCALAGVNFDRHFLVSCPDTRLSQLISGLKERGIVASELPIQRALHSSLIDRARPHFERACATIQWKPPAVSMFSPVRLEWVARLDAQYFWESCREPVRFADAIQQLERYGVSRFVDLGPSGTLANFVKYKLDARRSVTAINRLSKNSDSLAQLFRALGA